MYHDAPSPVHEWGWSPKSGACFSRCDVSTQNERGETRIREAKFFRNGATASQGGEGGANFWALRLASFVTRRMTQISRVHDEGLSRYKFSKKGMQIVTFGHAPRSGA